MTTSKDPPKTPFPFPTADNHDKPQEEHSQPKVETPSEDALDHGVEESFPASDPVSVTVTKTPSPTSGHKKSAE